MRVLQKWRSNDVQRARINFRDARELCTYADTLERLYVCACTRIYIYTRLETCQCCSICVFTHSVITESSGNSKTPGPLLFALDLISHFLMDILCVCMCAHLKSPMRFSTSARLYVRLSFVSPVSWTGIGRLEIRAGAWIYTVVRTSSMPSLCYR